MSWEHMNEWDRLALLNAIHPGAAEADPASNFLMHGHPETVIAQIERVAHLIAEELREVADWQYQDVEARADEWEAA